MYIVKTMDFYGMLHETYTSILMMIMIGMFAVVYGETFKWKIQQLEKDVAKANEEAKAAKTTCKKMDDEARRNGLRFVEDCRGFGFMHTNEWHDENKNFREELRKLRNENEYLETGVDKMISLGAKNGYTFKFEKGKCVGMTRN